VTGSKVIHHLDAFSDGEFSDSKFSDDDWAVVQAQADSKTAAAAAFAAANFASGYVSLVAGSLAEHAAQTTRAWGADWVVTNAVLLRDEFLGFGDACSEVELRVRERGGSFADLFDGIGEFVVPAAVGGRLQVPSGATSVALEEMKAAFRVALDDSSVNSANEASGDDASDGGKASDGKRAAQTQAGARDKRRRQAESDSDSD
jgi:hypothetical protein